MPVQLWQVMSTDAIENNRKWIYYFRMASNFAITFLKYSAFINNIQATLTLHSTHLLAHNVLIKILSVDKVLLQKWYWRRSFHSHLKNAVLLDLCETNQHFGARFVAQRDAPSNRCVSRIKVLYKSVKQGVLSIHLWIPIWINYCIHYKM